MLRLAFPLGKVDFVSPLVKQRTDEGRPSETVVTSKSVALAAAPSAPTALSERVLGSPVYLRQDVCAALPHKHFVFGGTPNTGGYAALVTINDGASPLIEGELARPKDLEA